MVRVGVALLLGLGLLGACSGKTVADDDDSSSGGTANKKAPPKPSPVVERCQTYANTWCTKRVSRVPRPRRSARRSLVEEQRRPVHQDLGRQAFALLRSNRYGRRLRHMHQGDQGHGLLQVQRTANANRDDCGARQL